MAAVLLLAVVATALTGGAHAALNVPITYTGCNAEPYGTQMTFEGQGPFSMLLDSGSANLIVAADRCTGCDTSPNYSGAGYNGAQFIQYGTGSIEIVSETGTVGLAGKVKVSDADFGPVVMSNDFFYPSSSTCYNSYQGVLGLAYPALSHPPGQPTFFDSLYQQQGIPNAFSTVLCPVWPNKISEGANLGELILGGASSNYGSNFQFTPVVQEMHYNVEVEGFSINGQTIPGMTDLNVDSSTYEDNAAYIDTGTTTLNLNSECNAWALFNAIDKVMTGLPHVDSDVWQNPCGSGSLSPGCFYKAKCFVKGVTFPQDTTFSVQLGGGVSVELDLNNFFRQGPNNEGLGQVAVMMYGAFTNTILGQPILMGQQVFFDRENSQVGFAPVPSGVCSSSGNFTSLINDESDIDIKPASRSSGGLSRGAIVGLACGGVALVALVALIAITRSRTNAYEPVATTELPHAAFKPDPDQLQSGYVLYEDGQQP